MKFKTGWYSTIVAIVRQTEKFKAMKKSGRITKLEFPGRFTARALRMHATEVKNEAKVSLLSQLKDSGTLFPPLVHKTTFGLPGHCTWASISLRRWLTSEHSLEVETGRYERVKEREKRICKECHRQSNGICFDVADEWHALDNICPRGEEKKIATLEFLTSLPRSEQIRVEKNDALVDLLPKLGQLSQRRCHIGWQKMAACLAGIEGEILAPGDWQS